MGVGVCVFNQELVLMRARVSKTTIDTRGISQKIGWLGWSVLGIADAGRSLRNEGVGGWGQDGDVIGSKQPLLEFSPALRI